MAVAVIVSVVGCVIAQADIDILVCLRFHRVMPAFTRMVIDLKRCCLDYDEAYIEDVKIKLLAGELRSSFFSLPNREGHIAFSRITDLEIARFLLRPPDYHLPPDERKPLRDHPLKDLVPTPKFFVVFSSSLKRTTPPYTTTCRRLDALFTKYRKESKNGHGLFGNEAAFRSVIHRAKRRMWHAGDPPGYDMYICVGENAKGLPELRSARGTQTTEQYHGHSNVVIGSDSLRPALGRDLLGYANVIFNVKRLIACQSQRALPSAIRHHHPNLTSVTALLAQSAMRRVVVPPEMHFYDITAELPVQHEVRRLGLPGMKVTLRDTSTAESSCVQRIRCAGQRQVWLMADMTKPRQHHTLPGVGCNRVGRQVGSKDKEPGMRPPRNAAKRAAYDLEKLKQGGQTTLFHGNRGVIDRANGRRLGEDDVISGGGGRGRGRGRGRGGGGR